MQGCHFYRKLEVLGNLAKVGEKSGEKSAKGRGFCVVREI